MGFLNVILLISLIPSTVTFASSEKLSGRLTSDKMIRQMLVTADGGLNFEVLKDIVKELIELDQEAGLRNTYNYNKHKSAHRLTAKNGYGRNSLALNNYLIIGKQADEAKPLNRNSPCYLCASAFTAVGIITSYNALWPLLVQLMKQLCPQITHFSKYACDGYVNEFEPIVLHLLPASIKSPFALCGQFLKNLGCGAHGNQQPLWQVDLPDCLPVHVPLLSPVQIRPTRSRLTVLHMTDLHIDVDYEPGSPAKCLEPMCCRKMSTPANNPVPDNEKAGYWGDYRKCDVPTWTFDDMLRQISENHGNEIDFIFVAGDLSAHDTWNSTAKMSMYMIDLVARKLAEKLPGKPVFFAIGNHEAAPVNIFSLPGDPERFSTQWLYDKIANTWMQWLDPITAASTVRKAGFYTVLLKPGWRLIVINDNFCYDNNFLLFAKFDMGDPHDQLQWMIGILTEAEKNGERVQIIGHIPPGSNDCLQAWSWNYYRIISRFAHIISGQFFGHSHEDSFFIYYDAETLIQPKSVAFIGPPGTPYSDHNLGYRLYDFDPNTYTLLNYRQYYADIAAANANGDRSRMPWNFAYSAKESYSLPDMSASSWNWYARRLQTDQNLFNLRRFHNRLNYIDPKNSTCESKCRRDGLCDIYHGLSNVPDAWCDRFIY